MSAWSFTSTQTGTGTAEVTRDDAGVVTVRTHTRGGPLQWGGRPHRELPADGLMPRAHEIAADLAKLNPILLRNTRHALVRPLRRAMADDLHTGLALEAIASMSAREWFRDQS